MKSKDQLSFENYKNNVRPALFDRNGQRAAQASLDKQRESYERDTAPKTSHGKQKAHDATILNGYRDMLRRAERDPLGPNPQRVRYYQDLIDQLESKMTNDKQQASFDGSKEFKSAVSMVDAIKAVSVDDTESQSLVDFALEALREHKDLKRFQMEVAPIQTQIETREQQRLADVEIGNIEARMKLAQSERDQARLEFDNRQKLDAAKGTSE
jgi:hypothetical protein